jgi:hypothetical protein
MLRRGVTPGLGIGLVGVPCLEARVSVVSKLALHPYPPGGVGLARFVGLDE